MKERLQKLLAQSGVASRRAAEAMIEQGRVTVNGTTAKLGDKADPETDLIMVDRARLRIEAVKKVYIALNKPKQVLSTTEPHKGDNRRTIYDLVKGTVKGSEHLVSIGRLDADSEGLIVLTNDGALAQRLTHPRYRHSKTYKVDVLGLPTLSTLDQWRNGVVLDEDGRTSPCIVSVMHGDKHTTTLRVIMAEGKKRQIRRIAIKLGHPVRKLVRTHIGLLSLEGLKPGEARELTPEEVKLLRTPAPELREIKPQPRVKPTEAKPDGESEVERPTRRKAIIDESEVRPRRSLVKGGTERPRRTQSDRDDRPSARRASRPAQSDETTERPADRPAKRRPPRPDAPGDRAKRDDRPRRTPRKGNK